MCVPRWNIDFRFNWVLIHPESGRVCHQPNNGALITVLPANSGGFSIYSGLFTARLVASIYEIPLCWYSLDGANEFTTWVIDSGRTLLETFGKAFIWAFFATVARFLWFYLHLINLFYYCEIAREMFEVFILEIDLHFSCRVEQNNKLVYNHFNYFDASQLNWLSHFLY